MTNTLLCPVKTEDFFENYWEQKPLHIDRKNSQHFSELADIDTIEKLIATNELYFPNLQLAQAPDTIAKTEYTDEQNRIVPSSVSNLYKAGATMVLSQAHNLVPALNQFVTLMEREFQLPCQCNLYLSPIGNQGFNAHYDSHDVFIVQISGQKCFNFYSGGVDLPFNEQRFNAESKGAGELKETVKVSAGDTLYIPRGFMHDAIAIGNSPSLHVTLGLFPVTALELLQEVIRVEAENNAQLRRSLPRSIWMNNEAVDIQLDYIKDQNLAHLFSAENLRVAVSHLKDDFAIEATRSTLRDLTVNTRTVDLSTVISINENQYLNVEKQGQLLRVRFMGQIVEFEDPMAGAVMQLLNVRTIKVGDMTSIDDNQKIALSNQLLGANLVRIIN